MMQGDMRKQKVKLRKQEVVNACVLFDFSCLLTLRPLLWVELGILVESSD